MHEPLRILHVVINMNRGGTENFIMNLYRNIDKTKVQFDFLTCKPGVFDNEILEKGGKIHRIPYISEVGHFNYVRELNNFFINNSDYKIVHSHLDKMSGLVLKSAKKHKIPVRISHSHSTKSEGGLISKIYKYYAGLFVNTSATVFMACSKPASKWLFGRDSEKSLIIKNGIDLQRFEYNDEIRKQLRDSLKISEDTFILGHVGRFSHPKNHIFLVNTFSEVLKLNDNSKLILVGDGGLINEVKQKVHSLGINDKVIFLGVREDVEKVLNLFDVFVFPSLYEGLPVTLIEAQASGLPCVISSEVTFEAGVVRDLTTFISLGNTKKWAEEIIKNKGRADRKTKSILNASGYNITSSVELLEEFYTKSLYKTKF